MAPRGLLSAEETQRLSVSSFHGFHPQPSPARILKKMLLLLLLIAGFSAIPMTTFAAPAGCQAWRRELPDTPMPKFLQSRVVSMSFLKILKFYDLIKKKMLSPYSIHFCRSAHLHCKSDVTIPSLEAGADHQYLSQYINRSEILLGGQIMVPDLGNDYPTRAFINDLFETRLHFSSQALSEMLQMLNIPQDSRLANYMNQTLLRCEMPDADCVTSLGKMLNLVLKKLGKNLEVLRTKWSNNARSKMTVMEMAFKGSHKSKKSLVCSEEMFPFAVYKCYEVEDVHNIEVTMETNDGKARLTAVMQCYSQQRKGSRLFAAAELVPNLQDQVCHWLTEKDIVFVQKDETNKKKKMMKMKQHFWRLLLPSTIPVPLP